jgi:hypothetical protein
MSPGRKLTHSFIMPQRVASAPAAGDTANADLGDLDTLVDC